MFKKILACVLVCLLLPVSAFAELAYLIPDSNTRELKESELWEWDYESLGYILNEIFARHGFNFAPGEKYDYYFNCMPWYTPNENPNNQTACYPKLSAVEWKNERLIKDVRAAMRASKNYNTTGKSVWDYFSTGFDTLQGFEYVTLKSGQKLAVYSAPSTQSWRGANGKASVSTNGHVWAAGWESGWLLVMYETNNGSVRVGYVNGADLKGSVPVDTFLSYAYSPAQVTQRCALTDDPARTNSSIMTLSPGSNVTYLSTYFNRSAWDYVETYVDGKIVRGFIPAGCLNIAQVDDPEIPMGIK